MTDPTDPRLGHGADDHPVPQQKAYLILSAEERAKGFIRPLRRSYVHSRNVDGITACGAVTRMSQAIAETYARQPDFYGATYCVSCGMHHPVACFTWDGTNELIGS
ncbi:MAG: hypothetical protein ABIP33_06375 [Pseudolysinimonas sp.]